MNKFFIYVAALAMSAAMLAPQGLSAQKRVVKVQGHPHELLTKWQAEGKWRQPKAPLKRLGDVPTPTCWTGHLDPTITSNYVDTAYLLVKWTDGKREALELADSMLIWGYVWNTISIYTYPDGTKDTSQVTAHTIDMLRAVANADCRFTILLQQTGVNGYTVGGIGYNYTEGDATRVPLQFDSINAFNDPLIKFHYDSVPNCAVGQTALPYLPATQAQEAIDVATGTNKPLALGTGIIEHPFNVNYGYPAYDYDYWVLTYPKEPNYEWQAGWSYNGYWAFYSGENHQVPTDYSDYGVTTRVLQNNSVDGFVFDINFTSHDMSGEITANKGCDCNPCPPVPPSPPSTKRK
jgi:hypothetical protein